MVVARVMAPGEPIDNAHPILTSGGIEERRLPSGIRRCSDEAPYAHDHAGDTGARPLIL